MDCKICGVSFIKSVFQNNDIHRCFKKPSILKVIYLSIGMLMLNACKSIDFDFVNQINTTKQVTLGSIGSKKEFVLQNGFKHSALPNYTEPIKLSVSLKPFTKQTYKAFLKAKSVQSSNINIRYIDSIPDKPKYIQVEIADKVALIKGLNDTENKEVKDYLSHNAYAQVTTGIDIALSLKDMEVVNDADAVFLEEHGYKTYALQLYKNKVKTQTIPFGDGVVFAYETANCCWEESSKHIIDIVDLVSTYNACPNNTYRSAKRAKKHINYYKL